VTFFSYSFFATALLPLFLFIFYESGILISGNSETEWLGTVMLGKTIAPLI
jgi:hypothetical protein